MEQTPQALADELLQTIVKYAKASDPDEPTCYVYEEIDDALDIVDEKIDLAAQLDGLIASTRGDDVVVIPLSWN